MVDVIVLTRDHPEYLERSIPSVEAQDVPYQGFLWDNGESVADIAEKYGWKHLRGDNPSFSEANNRAAAQGSSEWLLLLNDDAALQPGALKAMLSHQEPLVGGLIVQSDGWVNHAGVHLDGIRPFHVGRGDKPNRWMGECRYVPAVTFAVALIARSLWEHLGGLDTRYEWSYEDTDFCLRAAGAFVCCCQPIAQHDEFGTRTGANDGRNFQLFRERWTPRLRGEGNAEIRSPQQAV